MSEPPVIAPENCPEPFWHETHMYCPVCTWQEAQPEPELSDLDRARDLLLRWCEGWSDESEFPLLQETRDFLADPK
jgi:hypothetical protein